MKKILYTSILLTPLFSQEISEIIVSDKKNDPSEIASTNIDEKEIARNFQGNGDIAAALQLHPNIEIEDKNNLENIADISPRKIEINGSKFYQNLSLVDGISNNSSLDPAEQRTNDILDVPGNENEMFIDLDLIENIKVYDSMVPAKYGNFNGGVIDIETKRARFKKEGKIKYKATKASLVNFHYKDVKTEKDVNDINSLTKPNFKKDFFNLYYTSPINDKSAIWASYSYKKSQEPKPHFNTLKQTSKINQNFLSKYSYFLDDDSIIDLSLLYAPYENKLFRKDVKNSEYTNKGGGISAKLNYEKNFNFWTIKSNLSLSRSENSRENSAKDYKSWIKTNTKNWGLQKASGTLYSNEGGYGNIKKTEDYLKSNLHLESKRFLLGEVENRLSTGFEFSYGRANYLRKENSYAYFDAKLLTGIKCNGNNNDCVEGEQFFKQRTVYQKEDVSVDISKLGTYFDNKLRYKNISFTPGLRVDYNNFLKNLDFAHRLNTSIDVFKDGKTQIFAGINRYYGKSFLGFKLREARSPYRSEYRSSYQGEIDSQKVPSNQTNPTVWNASSDKAEDKYIYNNLKTPYTDEKVLGLRQEFLNNSLLVKYITREGKNQFKEERGEYEAFTRPDGLISYHKPISVTNKGKNEFNALSISLGNQKAIKISKSDFFYKFSTSINTKREANFTSYNLEEGFSKEKVKVDGKVYDYNDLPSPKKAKKLKLNLSFENIKTNIFSKQAKFSFSNLLVYTLDYKALVKRSVGDTYIEEFPDGSKNQTNITVFDTKNYDKYLTLDTRFNLDFKLNKKQKLLASFEVLNVFDKKVQEKLDRNFYDLGRQVWFELAYKF